MIKFNGIIENGLYSYDAWNINNSLMLVILSISDLCNRNCDNCPRGHGYKHLKWLPNYMSLDTVELICKQLGSSYKGFISISGLGEPTLCLDLYKIIQLIKIKCPLCKLVLITNGYKLTREIIDMEELFRISISVYSKADFDYYFSLYNDTRVTFLKQYVPFLKPGDFNNRAGNVYKVVNFKGACFMPFFQITVDTDGSCYQCSCDWKREYAVGNIFKESIKDIFINNLKKIRVELLLGHRNNLKLCSGCSVTSDFEKMDILKKRVINNWRLYYQL